VGKLRGLTARSPAAPGPRGGPSIAPLGGVTETARPLLLAALLVACTPAELSSALDAGGDAGAPPSADVADVASAPPEVGAPMPDASTAFDVTAAPADVSAADVGPEADVLAPRDAGAVSDVLAPRDAGAVSDVLAPRDAGAVSDVPAPRDAGAASDAPPPRDVVATADVPAPRDVSAPSDVGCGVTARVVAPVADEVIETCSASGAAVFYDFRAEVTGPAAPLQPRWRTPDGDLAPSPDLRRTVAPWVFRRQVGGPSSAAPALGVFPNALRGTWRFEVLVTDGCGRETLVSQTFQLTFTNRRCPNP
jgi:hypothetical protein